MSLFCSKKLWFWSFYLPVMTNVTLYIILFFFLKFSLIQILPRLRNQHRLWVEICLKSKGIQVKELPQWELRGLGSSLILGSWREFPAFGPPLLQHRIVLMRSTKYHWLLTKMKSFSVICNKEWDEIPPNVDIATKIGMINANGPYILSANVYIRKD